MNSLIKTAQSAVFIWRRQPRNFENVTLVARRREHFWVLGAIFLVAQLPPKRGVLVHKNSLASCQRCRHSVEPRALNCPFKQSNLGAGSCQNLRLWVMHSPCCTLFFINSFGIEMVLCDLYLKGLIWQRVCYLTLSQLLFGTNYVIMITQYWEFESLSPPMTWYTEQETSNQMHPGSGKNMKKMRRRPDFLTKSWWVLCPIDIVCNLFFTNHSLQSSSFD